MSGLALSRAQAPVLIQPMSGLGGAKALAAAMSLAREIIARLTERGLWPTDSDLQVLETARAEASPAAASVRKAQPLQVLLRADIRLLQQREGGKTSRSSHLVREAPLDRPALFSVKTVAQAASRPASDGMDEAGAKPRNPLVPADMRLLRPLIANPANAEVVQPIRIADLEGRQPAVRRETAPEISSNAKLAPRRNAFPASETTQTPASTRSADGGRDTGGRQAMALTRDGIVQARPSPAPLRPTPAPSSTAASARAPAAASPVQPDARRGDEGAGPQTADLTFPHTAVPSAETPHSPGWRTPGEGAMPLAIARRGVSDTASRGDRRVSAHRMAAPIRPAPTLVRRFSDTAAAETARPANRTQGGGDAQPRSQGSAAPRLDVRLSASKRDEPSASGQASEARTTADSTARRVLGSHGAATAETPTTTPLQRLAVDDKALRQAINRLPAADIAPLADKLFEHFERQVRRGLERRGRL